MTGDWIEDLPFDEAMARIRYLTELPHVTAGQKITNELREVVLAFLEAHPDRKQAGMVFTAQLANEAIDWFNNTGGRSD